MIIKRYDSHNEFAHSGGNEIMVNCLILYRAIERFNNRLTVFSASHFSIVKKLSSYLFGLVHHPYHGKTMRISLLIVLQKSNLMLHQPTQHRAFQRIVSLSMPNAVLKSYTKGLFFANHRRMLCVLMLLKHIHNETFHYNSSTCSRFTLHQHKITHLMMLC